MSAVLDELAEVGAPAEREGFQITDLSAATWAMKKVARIRARQAEIHAAACAEIDRLKAWDAAEQHRLDSEAAFFVEHLIDYHRRLIAEDPKAKTIRLPHGELRCRAQQPEWTKDEIQLLAWAQATDPVAFVQIKETAKWAEIKKRGVLQPDGSLVYVETGEVIPGVTAIERPPKFTVEVEVG